MDRPAIGERFPNWKPSETPIHRIEQNAAIAMRYPALQPLRPGPQRIPEVPAGSVPVTNCNDAGAGSLRDAISIATTGQTIDLTATGCSTITLTTGDIVITQEDLTLQGPGPNSLTIDGNYLYSLRHINGAGGVLGVNDLTVSHGSKYLDATFNINAKGGCLYSYGTVSMARSVVKYCTADTANASFYAAGGAIYARNGVVMSNSYVVLSSAGSTTSTGAGGGIFTPGAALIAYSGIGLDYASTIGGGIFASNGFLMKYSSMLVNQAFQAGALRVGGNITIENSTIALNNAAIGGAGYLVGYGATSPTTVVNSTISGNTASIVGGLVVAAYPARIANSTIAFNTEANSGNVMYGAGLYADVVTELESSIITNNTLTHSVYGPISDDIGGTGVLSGSNNMTQFVLGGTSAPPGTLYDDPRLASLTYNGGLTQTHALPPLSPAVEAGNNVAGLATDQRGPGFARVIGANADIGALEFDLADLIFADDFES